MIAMKAPAKKRPILGFVLLGLEIIVVIAVIVVGWPLHDPIADMPLREFYVRVVGSMVLFITAGALGAVVITLFDDKHHGPK